VHTGRVQHDGNGWIRCGHGHRHWGRYGAAGLLLVDRRDPDQPSVLLQHRAPWTSTGDTWGVPGGARDSHEDAAAAALREAEEETGVRAEVVRVVGELEDDHGGWVYVTVLAELVTATALRRQDESLELRWVPVSAVDALPLHPGFAGTWPQLRELVAAFV